MMEKLVFFCKSYDKDMLRARRMAESVHRFNKDGILLYLSVPEKDLADFKKCLADFPVHFFTDEQILEMCRQANGKIPGLFPPHLIQQLLKLEFWRTGVCENYAWIDSDSYFIRPFETADFFWDDRTPYLIQDEYNAEKELQRMQHVPQKIREKRVRNICELITKFRELFGNTGPFVAFGGSTPIIWSCRVLESFNTEYLKSENKRIYEILDEYPCETQLYGEYLHYSRAIELKPHPHMFKSFYHADDFFISQERGENEYSIAKEYAGICIQSNWARLKEKKKTKDRLIKHAGEYLRALGFGQK